MQSARNVSHASITQLQSPPVLCCTCYTPATTSYTTSAAPAATCCVQDHPDYMMAQALKADVDDQVMKDGLIGLGLVGGVAALAVGLLLGGSRSKH